MDPVRRPLMSAGPLGGDQGMQLTSPCTFLVPGALKERHRAGERGERMKKPTAREKHEVAVWHAV